VAGTFQVQNSYVHLTSINVPYLKFAVTFTTYNNQTGAITSIDPFDPVYFALNQVTPTPVPSED
jgi:hypothetical protein